MMRLRGLSDVELTVANTTGISDLRKEESSFAQTCEQQLLNASSAEGISQISFSAVAAGYCREVTGVVARGPACSETLLLFQDLPWALQVRFATDVTDRPCVSSDAVHMILCLDELNAGGELFHVGPEAIPNLCSDLFDLMIATDLVTVSDKTLSVSAPIVPVVRSKEPTSSPVVSQWNPVPTTTASNQSTGAALDGTSPRTSELSLVVGLGLAMSAIFAVALAVRLIRVQRNKPASTDFALLADESVSSENSHELDMDRYTVSAATAAVAKEVVHDDSSVTSSTSSWFGISSTPKSTSSIGSRGRTTVRRERSFAKSKRSHSTGCLKSFPRDPPGTKYNEIFRPERHGQEPKRRLSCPPPLLTENLSDDNPVHIRKRFSHRRGSSFTFDETDISRSRAAATEWTHGKREPSRSNVAGPVAEATPPYASTTLSTPTVLTVNKENAGNFRVERATENQETRSSEKSVGSVRHVGVEPRGDTISSDKTRTVHPLHSQQVNSN